MSDTNLLAQKQPAAVEETPSGQVVRSQSLPSVARPDVSSLYTRPSEGVTSLLFLFFQLIRDVFTFFFRVALSTMMFLMDLVLRLFVFVLEIWLQLPGAAGVSLLVRFLVWCYQIIMWIVYTCLELLLYLPTPILAIYIMAIVFLYFKMPGAAEAVLHSMWWLVERFLKMVAYFALPSVIDL